jgi:hypothetical protein
MFLSNAYRHDWDNREAMDELARIDNAIDDMRRLVFTSSLVPDDDQLRLRVLKSLQFLCEPDVPEITQGRSDSNDSPEMQLLIRYLHSTLRMGTGLRDDHGYMGPNEPAESLRENFVEMIGAFK